MRFKRSLAVLFVAGVSLAWAERPEQRLTAAANVVSELMSSSDRNIPRELMDRAHCVVVVPGLKGGAFFVGGKWGKGFVSCRNQQGWSAPAAIRVEQGSFGFQVGGIDTDLVMLVMNDRGVRNLVKSQFTIGSQSEVAGGPVGRSTTAETDATMSAEMLSWSRSRGVFAGIALSGATLRQDTGANEELYGRAYRNKQILFQNVPWPAAGGEFHSVLNRYAGFRQVASR